MQLLKTKNSSDLIFLLAVLAACALVPPAAHAGTIAYTVTNLGTLGGSASTAMAINANGDVVGYSYTASDGATHGFISRNGVLTDVGSLGGNSQAFGVNDNGDVVGISFAGTDFYRAFLYHNGVISDIGTLGGNDSVAQGINNQGQITGFAAVSGIEVPRHAFLYENGSMHDLGTIGGTNSGGLAINNNGVVAGGGDVAGNTTDHTVVFSGGTAVDLDSSDGLYNNGAYAINASGDIAGVTGGPANNSGHVIAILYRNGSVTQLPSLLGPFDYALGINATDQIVGQSGPCAYNLDLRFGDAHPYGCATNQAFVYVDGTVFSPDSLITTSGWHIDNAAAINDAGQIAATGVFNGHAYAVRLDPVAAEPNTLLLLVGAVSGLAMARRAVSRRVGVS